MMSKSSRRISCRSWMPPWDLDRDRRAAVAGLDQTDDTGSDAFRLAWSAGATVGGIRIHGIRSPNIYDRQEVRLGRVGGLTPGRLLRDVAMSLGLTVSIEDAWGGDITAAAVSYLTASTPERSLLTASFFNDWTTEHVATTRPVSAGGRGSVPLGDGLGILVEEPSLGGPLFTAGST